MVAGQYRNLHGSKDRLHSIRPGILEENSVNCGDQVDSDGWNSYLENKPRTAEIGHGEVMKWRAESGQGGQDAGRVRVRRANPEVEILRGADVTMGRQCVRTDYQKLNASRVELE